MIGVGTNIWNTRKSSAPVANPPAKMDAPGLAGGVELVTLTLAAADPASGSLPITHYIYQLTTAADDFSNPIASGTIPVSSRNNPINISPILVAGNYKARSAACSAAGNGIWSDPSALAAVTTIPNPVEAASPNRIADKFPSVIAVGQPILSNTPETLGANLFTLANIANVDPATTSLTYQAETATFATNGNSLNNRFNGIVAGKQYEVRLHAGSTDRVQIRDVNAGVDLAYVGVSGANAVDATYRFTAAAGFTTLGVKIYGAETNIVVSVKEVIAAVVAQNIDLKTCFTGGAAPYVVTAAGLPAGVAIVNSIIDVSQVAAVGQGREHDVVFTCTDANNRSVDVPFLLTVNETLELLGVEVYDPATGSVITTASLGQTVAARPIWRGWPQTAPKEAETNWAIKPNTAAAGTIDPASPGGDWLRPSVAGFTGSQHVVKGVEDGLNANTTSLTCRMRLAVAYDPNTGVTTWSNWLWDNAPVSIVSEYGQGPLALNGGTGYLLRNSGLSDASPNALFADSERLTFAFRALIPASSIGAAQRPYQLTGRSYVQITSTGLLELYLYNTANVLIGRFQSSSSIAHPDERVFVFSINTTSGQVSGQVFVDGVALAGSWITPLVAGVIDHTRTAMQFLAGSSGTSLVHQNTRWRWIYYSATHAKDPALFGSAADNIDPATIGDAQVLFSIPANIVSGNNTGAPQGGSDIDFVPTGGGLALATDGPVLSAPFFPDALGPATQVLGAHAGSATPAIRFVENLNNSGAGSFRDLVADNTPAIVLFKVGGKIHLQTECIIGDYKTILVETAPEPLTFTGSRLVPRGSEIVISGVRARMPDVSSPPQQAATERDGITVSRGSRTGLSNIHVYASSIVWTPDESGIVWENVQNVAFTHCLFAEAFDSPFHTDPERHDYGPYIGGESNDRPVGIAIIRCVIASVLNRAPAIAWSTDVVVAECVGYNFINAGAELYDGCENVDIINNAYVAGPATGSNAHRAILLSGKTAGATVHISGNITPNGNDFISYANGSNATYFDFSPTPTAASVYTPTLTAAQALVQVPDMVGAKQFGALDAIDLRILSYVESGGPASGPWSTSASVTDPLSFFSLPVDQGTPPRSDVDNNGIIDAYEVAMGEPVGSLSPSDVIDATAKGLLAKWNGKTHIAHQNVWLRTGDLEKIPAAPTVTVLPAISENGARLVTISLGAATGYPTPTVSLYVLTNEGVDVLGDETGTGPWQYLAPGVGEVDIAATVRYTNASGTADVPLSITIPASGGVGAMPAISAISAIDTTNKILLYVPSVPTNATSLEYQIDSGAITPLDVCAPGVFFIASGSGAIKVRGANGAEKGAWSNTVNVTVDTQSNTLVRVWADGPVAQKTTGFATSLAPAAIPNNGGDIEFIGTGSVFTTRYDGLIDGTEFNIADSNTYPTQNGPAGFVKGPAGNPPPPSGKTTRDSWIIVDPLGAGASLLPGQQDRTRTVLNPAGTQTTVAILGACGMVTDLCSEVVCRDANDNPVFFTLDKDYEWGYLPGSDRRRFLVAPNGVRFCHNGGSPVPVFPDPAKGYIAVEYQGATLYVVKRAGIIPPTNTTPFVLNLSEDYVRKAGAKTFSNWGADDANEGAANLVGANRNVNVVATYDGFSITVKDTGALAYAAGTTMDVRFRKDGDAAWLPAQPMLWINSSSASNPDIGVNFKWRGRIRYLKSDTLYQVQIRHRTSGGTNTHLLFTVRTRAFQATTPIYRTLGTVSGNVTVAQDASGNITFTLPNNQSLATVTAAERAGGKHVVLRDGVIRRGQLVIEGAVNLRVVDVDCYGADGNDQTGSGVYLDGVTNDVMIFGGRISGFGGRNANGYGWKNTGAHRLQSRGNHTNFSLIGRMIGMARNGCNTWQEQHSTADGKHPYGPTAVHLMNGTTSNYPPIGLYVRAVSIKGHNYRLFMDGIVNDPAGTTIGPGWTFRAVHTSGMADDGCAADGLYDLDFLFSTVDMEQARPGCSGPRFGFSASAYDYKGPVTLCYVLFKMRNDYIGGGVTNSTQFRNPGKLQIKGTSAPTATTRGKFTFCNVSFVGDPPIAWRGYMSGSGGDYSAPNFAFLNVLYHGNNVSPNFGAVTSPEVVDAIFTTALTGVLEVDPTTGVPAAGATALINQGTIYDNMNDAGPYGGVQNTIGARLAA